MYFYFMRIIPLLLIIFFVPFFSIAFENDKLDSLFKVLKHSKSDTNKVLLLLDISNEYSKKTEYEKVIQYAEIGMSLSKKLHYKKGIILNLSLYTGYYVRKQNQTRALKYIFEAYEISQNDPKLAKENLTVLSEIAFVYTSFNDYKEAIKYKVKNWKGIEKLLKTKAYIAIKTNDLHKDSLDLALAISNLSYYHFKIKEYNSALYYSDIALGYLNKINKEDPSFEGYTLSCMGSVYRESGKIDLAISTFRKCIKLGEKSIIKKNRITVLYKSNWEMAILKKIKNDIDSSIYYAEIALKLCEGIKWGKDILEIKQLLAENYVGIDNSKAIGYYKESIKLNKELNDKTKLEHLQMMTSHEEERQIEMEEMRRIEEEERRKKIEYALIALSIVISILSFVVLSGSIITSATTNKFLTSLILLFVFEFFNLFLGPYIGEYTNNLPTLTFISAICLALVLSPFHGHLEKWIEKKMIIKSERKNLNK